jgi:hypothetical protein
MNSTERGDRNDDEIDRCDRPVPIDARDGQFYYSRARITHNSGRVQLAIEKQAMIL